MTRLRLRAKPAPAVLSASALCGSVLLSCLVPATAQAAPVPAAGHRSLLGSLAPWADVRDGLRAAGVPAPSGLAGLPVPRSGAGRPPGRVGLGAADPGTTQARLGQLRVLAARMDARGAAGYAFRDKLSVPGATLAARAVVDPRHRAQVRTTVAVGGRPALDLTVYLAERRASWTQIPAQLRPRLQPVLVHVGRPGARYIRVADRSAGVGMMRPGQGLLDSFDGLVVQSIAKSDDGAGHLRYTLTLADGATPLGTETVDATAGLVTRARLVTPEGVETLAWTWGRHVVRLPAAAVSVSDRTLELGVEALALPGRVRDHAAAVASGAEFRARHARRAVTVTDIRRVARRIVVRTGGQQLRERVVRVRGGVRISATDPFTGRTVRRLVLLVHGRVVVR